jgi:cytochrome c peroxidase
MPYRAFTEPRPVSHGIGLHARKRNTPSLINIAGFRSSFDWDGRASTLEAQLRGVFSATGDMGIDLSEAVARVRVNRDYDPEFRRVYGRRADVASVAAAFADYQRSLNVGGSRFERFYLGGDSTALSAAELRGWRLFRTGRAGCAGCHTPLPDPAGSGALEFSDDRFHNLGVGYRDGRMGDVGRYSVTRRPSDWGKFHTPPLLNVELSAPYMHDGSLATLEDVVEFYAKGGVRNPNLDVVMGRRDLSKREQSDLVAFLRTLTTPWLVDSATVHQRLMQFGGSAAPATRAP